MPINQQAGQRTLRSRRTPAQQEASCSRFQHRLLPCRRRQEGGSAHGFGSRDKVKPKRVAARTVAVLVMVTSTPSSSTQLPAGALVLGIR